MAQFRHKYLIPVLSRLPDSVLRYLHKRWPIFVDPSDGWSLWMDASYLDWVRRDMKKNA